LVIWGVAPVNKVSLEGVKMEVQQEVRKQQIQNVGSSNSQSYSTLRIISRVAILLVVMGFFMPMCWNQTGFELAEYTTNLGKATNDTSLGMSLYGLFISALIGGGLLIPLGMKKKVHIGFDLISLVVSFVLGIFIYAKTRDFFQAEMGGQTLQIGGWFAIIGLIGSALALIFLYLKIVEKKKLGKVLIGLGFVLIGVPFLVAVIGDFWDFLFRGRFFPLFRFNPLSPLNSDRTYDNFFTRWIFYIFNLPRIRFPPNLSITFLKIFLNNIFYLFIPNALIIFGFGMLLNHNQKIDIKKCFNKVVIIGLAINLLVLFGFFGLYSYLYRSIYMEMRFQGFFRFLRKLGRVGDIIIFFIIPIIFHIIPVLPTFIIVAGYMKSFKNEKIKSQTAFEETEKKS
jgi:hypothetical protein